MRTKKEALGAKAGVDLRLLMVWLEPCPDGKLSFSKDSTTGPRRRNERCVREAMDGEVLVRELLGSMRPQCRGTRLGQEQTRKGENAWHPRVGG